MPLADGFYGVFTDAVGAADQDDGGVYLSLFVYGDFEQEIPLPPGFACRFGEAWRVAKGAFRRGSALGIGGRGADHGGVWGGGPIYGIARELGQIWR